MYSAYFDESGHPDDSPRVIVAGCIGKADQWARFEQEWKGALAPFNTELFHAVDFEQRKSPFNVDDRKANDLLSHLIGIIGRRIEKNVASAVPMDQDSRMNEKYLLGEYFGFPYPCAARSCIAHVEAWADRYGIPFREVMCVFEDGAKHKVQLLWMAERDKFPLPVLQKKTDVVALQAGDLIAWLHNRPLNKVPDDGVRYSQAVARLETMPHEWFAADFADRDEGARIHGISLRDHSREYKCRIVKKDGDRRALIHNWRKGSGSI